MSWRRVARWISVLLLCWGGFLLVGQGWMAVKAHLASRMIHRAYAAHLEDGRAHRPWRWADTHPLARLRFPRLDVERIVLAGAGGSSLAFGPGHLHGSAPLGGPGNAVVAGHRDSWFAFLRRVEVGDLIELETRDGSRRYRVAATEVRSMWDPDVTADDGGERLTLLTCYPFDALGEGERRWVVTGIPEARPRSTMDG